MSTTTQRKKNKKEEEAEDEETDTDTEKEQESKTVPSEEPDDDDDDDKPLSIPRHRVRTPSSALVESIASSSPPSSSSSSSSSSSRKRSRSKQPTASATASVINKKKRRVSKSNSLPPPIPDAEASEATWESWLQKQPSSILYSLLNTAGILEFDDDDDDATDDESEKKETKQHNRTKAKVVMLSTYVKDVFETERYPESDKRAMGTKWLLAYLTRKDHNLSRLRYIVDNDPRRSEMLTDMTKLATDTKEWLPKTRECTLQLKLFFIWDHMPSYTVWKFDSAPSLPSKWEVHLRYQILDQLFDEWNTVEPKLPWLSAAAADHKENKTTSTKVLVVHLLTPPSHCSTPSSHTDNTEHIDDATRAMLTCRCMGAAPFPLRTVVPAPKAGEHACIRWLVSAKHRVGSISARIDRLRQNKKRGLTSSKPSTLLSKELHMQSYYHAATRRAKPILTEVFNKKTTATTDLVVPPPSTTKQQLDSNDLATLVCDYVFCIALLKK